MMLMEKFDIMGKVVDLVTNLFYAFTDAIGLTNKADEKFAKEAVANAQNVQKAKEAQYDAEIKMAQAAGQDVKELELEKLKSIEDSIQSQLTALEDLKTKKKKLNDEEQKQYDELQLNLMKSSADRMAKELSNAKEQQQQLSNLANLEDKLRVAGLSAREKEIDAVKKQQEQLLAELNKNHRVRQGTEMQDTIRFNEDKKKIEELTQREINKINNKYYEENRAKKEAAKEKEIKDSEDLFNLALQDGIKAEELRIKEEQDLLKAEEKKKADYEKFLEWEKAARLKRDQEEVAEFIEKENQLKKEQEDNAKRKKEYAERDFKLTKDGLAAGQALSDAVFAIQASKLKKGSAESEALAKKQFQVNKAFNLATATADGYKAVISTFAGTPGGVVIKSIAASIAGVFAAAQIAKIASAKFEGGGSAPTADTNIGGNTMTTAEPPTITQPMSQQPTTPGTNFDAQGNVIGGGAMKAYVVETEITSKQTTVNRLQSQAEFG